MAVPRLEQPVAERPRLVDLADGDLNVLLAALTDEQAHAILYTWAEWGRPEQVWRPGREKYTVYSCGRFWGKTRTGGEAVRWVAENPRTYFGTADKTKWRIGIVGRTAADVRGTMIYGPSGIMAVSDPLFMPVHNKSERTLTWPNGVVATTYSAEESAQLRGPGFGFCWCDELAFWKLGADDSTDAWAMVTFCMREAKQVPGGARCIVTTTPIPNRTIKELFRRARAGDPAVRIVRGGSRENLANIDRSTLEELEQKYKGTRLERQELGGELLDDNPAALWRHDMFLRHELDFDDMKPGESMEAFIVRALGITAVCVAVDPAVSQGKDACETGIVVVGRARRGRFFVLEDCSVSMADVPAGALAERVWTQRAMEAAWRWRADWITAEVNNGGNLVRAALLSYMQAAASAKGALPREVKYQAVHAAVGKGKRAEPVALLYDQGRVEHVGDPRRYRMLEHQMVDFDPRRPSAEQDCDRMDALVWGLTSLTEEAPSGEWSTLDSEEDWSGLDDVASAWQGGAYGTANDVAGTAGCTQMGGLAARPSRGRGGRPHEGPRGRPEYSRGRGRPLDRWRSHREAHLGAGHALTRGVYDRARLRAGRFGCGVARRTQWTTHHRTCEGRHAILQVGRQNRSTKTCARPSPISHYSHRCPTFTSGYSCQSAGPTLGPGDCAVGDSVRGGLRFHGLPGTTW